MLCFASTHKIIYNLADFEIPFLMLHTVLFLSALILNFYFILFHLFSFVLFGLLIFVFVLFQNFKNIKLVECIAVIEIQRSSTLLVLSYLNSGSMPRNQRFTCLLKIEGPCLK